ncbi:transposase [Cyanobium sp. AMD-g]|uniref:transposase n=1 Tax=Cyanobium sp. AMD-g TaxID=2823699 RepID=UPI0020CF85D9|nr:transposase [Cyanobium sp. AMD-g]MCP9930603.1 transposase [Cyanobium sp. AMD-g]
MQVQQLRRCPDSVSRLTVRLALPFNDGSNGLHDAELEQALEACQTMAQKLDCDLLEISGEADHFHLLVEIPPNQSVGGIAYAMKKAVDSMLRKQFPMHPLGKQLWSPTYTAFTTAGETPEIQ